MNQKNRGIILSYVNLLMGMVVNLLFTPALTVALGEVDYSLYKVMQSFAGPLSVFQLGISTVVTRSIVRAKNTDAYTETDKQNTIALSLIASAAMAAIMMLLGLAMHRSIPVLYGNTYSEASLQTGQRMFAMYVTATILHMLTDVFSGCILGHERYVVSAAVPLCKTVSKCMLMVVLLTCNFGALFVVTIDLILAAGVFLFSAGYTFAILHEIPKLSCFDKGQLVEILSFGAAILLQAFVNQINNNVDTMILGVYIEEKYIITMYSSALTIYAIYNSLISVITRYFVPQATKLMTKNASGKELTDFVIGPGRFQAVIAVACIFGFTLFGRNFIAVWIGERYMDAYGVILLLMIPVTIPLVENAVISILDAAMKRMYRSMVLVVMAVLNVIVSVWLVKRIGFWGAAAGTALSLLVGHGLLMNVYYAKTFRIEVFRMFREIFRGILPAGILSGLLCVPLVLFVPDTLPLLVVKCGCFGAVYCVLLYRIGLNDGEKGLIHATAKKLLRK